MLSALACYVLLKCDSQFAGAEAPPQLLLIDHIFASCRSSGAKRQRDHDGGAQEEPKRSKPDIEADVSHPGAVQGFPAAQASSIDGMPGNLPKTSALPAVGLKDASENRKDSTAATEDGDAKGEHRSHRRHKSKHHRRDRDGSDRDKDGLRQDKQHRSSDHQVCLPGLV